MPHPIRYKDGYRVNFHWPPRGKPDSKQYRRRFPDNKFDDPLITAREFIRSVIGRSSGLNESGHSLSNLVDDYLRWCETSGFKRQSTLKTDRQRLTTFLSWCDTQPNIQDPEVITAKLLWRFQEYFNSGGTWYQQRPNRSRGDRKKTWNRYLSLIAAFCKWCVSRGYLEEMPFRRSELLVPEGRPAPKRIYSPDELSQVFDVIDSWESPLLSAMFRTLSLAGLRVGEACSLKWADVDFSHKLITIRASKNLDDNTIPILKELSDHLQELPRQSDYVLSKEDGDHPYRSDYWPRIWKRALAEAGIPTGRLHDLRHTFVTSLIEAGVPLPVVQQLARHRNIGTTMHYAHLRGKHLSDGLEKLLYRKKVG